MGKGIKKIFTFMILLIGLSACTVRSTTEIYDSFDATGSLLGEKHDIPPIMLYPKNIFLKDSFLVVFNEKIDTCFQVFDKIGFGYKYAFGIKGEGPDDLILPVSQLVANNHNETIVLDMNRLKKISFVNDQPTISNLEFSGTQPFYNGLIKLTDSLYICDAGLEEENEYAFIYPNGELKKWGVYPKGIERFGNLLSRNQAYTKIKVAHPSGKYFAAFYTNSRKLRIYDISGNMLHDIELNILPGEQEVPLEVEKRYIYAIGAYATENYIYTLNLDMTPQDIYARKYNPSLQVFSWEGKPLKQYKLNCYISAFTIDEASRTVYGVFAEDESSIYTFNLDSL
ncbi:MULTISPECIES: BF3164 family lipoprotein [Bacteroides]|jgi:hypothetical protein|uniref:6-bladed beta-propeller n=1 Tax=Bacteroides intestinalis TaxID=329854 RepID=A0A6N2WYT2_9BACE|nr:MULTISPECIES: BF3164 family lipoprotein [Bacteroides]